MSFKITALNGLVKAEPKAADLRKFAHLEVGQIVSTLAGPVFRVISKTTGADAIVFRLANLAGKPVDLTAEKFAALEPISPLFARIAARFRFLGSISFNTIVHEALKQAGIPVDPKMNWDGWFNTTYVNRLYNNTDVPKDEKELAREVAQEIAIKELWDRGALSKMEAAYDGPTAWRPLQQFKNLPLAQKASEYLKILFGYRYSDAVEIVRRNMHVVDQPAGRRYKCDDCGKEFFSGSAKKNLDCPSCHSKDVTPFGGAVSLTPEADEAEGEDYEQSTLDTIEHGTAPDVEEELQREDIRRFSKLFEAYLKQQRSKQAKGLILLWHLMAESAEQDTATSHSKRNLYSQEWEETTGLGHDAFKGYLKILDDLLLQFIEENPDLEDKFEIVRLVKNMAEKRRKAPTKASSLNSLNLAGVEASEPWAVELISHEAPNNYAVFGDGKWQTHAVTQVEAQLITDEHNEAVKAKTGAVKWCCDYEFPDNEALICNKCGERHRTIEHDGNPGQPMTCPNCNVGELMPLDEPDFDQLLHEDQMDKNSKVAGPDLGAAGNPNDPVITQNKGPEQQQAIQDKSMPSTRTSPGTAVPQRTVAPEIPQVKHGTEEEYQTPCCGQCGEELSENGDCDFCINQALEEKQGKTTSVHEDPTTDPLCCENYPECDCAQMKEISKASSDIQTRHEELALAILEGRVDLGVLHDMGIDDADGLANAILEGRVDHAVLEEQHPELEKAIIKTLSGYMEPNVHTGATPEEMYNESEEDPLEFDRKHQPDWDVHGGEYWGDPLPEECVLELTTPGAADSAAAWWQQQLGFDIPREEAIAFILPTGGWTAEELAEESDDKLSQIVLWIVAGSQEKSPTPPDETHTSAKEDMDAPHYGAVCEECGRTVTNGEYSCGDSNCCGANVVAEEEFGKTSEDKDAAEWNGNHFVALSATDTLSLEEDIIPGDRGSVREQYLNSPEGPQKPWFCLDCNMPVDLDQQGRCEQCGSEAVDVASHGKKPEIMYPAPLTSSSKIALAIGDEVQARVGTMVFTGILQDFSEDEDKAKVFDPKFKILRTVSFRGLKSKTDLEDHARRYQQEYEENKQRDREQAVERERQQLRDSSLNLDGMNTPENWIDLAEHIKQQPDYELTLDINPMDEKNLAKARAEYADWTKGEPLNEKAIRQHDSARSYSWVLKFKDNGFLDYPLDVRPRDSNRKGIPYPVPTFVSVGNNISLQNGNRPQDVIGPLVRNGLRMRKSTKESYYAAAKKSSVSQADWDAIRPGDRLTILVPGGMGREGREWIERSGRVVMRSSTGGWVLNMGGQHGTPGLANFDNTVKIQHKKREETSAYYKKYREAAGAKECPDCLQVVRTQNGKFITHESRKPHTWCNSSGKLAMAVDDAGHPVEKPTKSYTDTGKDNREAVKNFAASSKKSDAADGPGKYKVYTGPTLVQEVAKRLTEAGLDVTLEGTEHVYVMAPDRETITKALGWGRGWTWRDVHKISSRSEITNVRKSGNMTLVEFGPKGIDGHCSLAPQDVEGVKALKAESGNYRFRDEQGIRWVVSLTDGGDYIFKALGSHGLYGGIPYHKLFPAQKEGSKTAGILQDAVDYFIRGRKDKHEGLGSVFNETYQRTGEGEEKYMAVSRLMMDAEYSLEDPDTLADVINDLRRIIGDDPNYSEAPAKVGDKLFVNTKNSYKEAALRFRARQEAKVAGPIDWMKSKTWPTQLVMALASLLVTAQGAEALKAQVAQELKDRGQEVPAKLMLDPDMPSKPEPNIIPLENVAPQVTLPRLDHASLKTASPSWLNAHDPDTLPVQVVGVKDGRITANGWGYQEFPNLVEAMKVFPDLDPYGNGHNFTWAMRGEVDGQPAMRFETWAADARYSA